MLKESEWNNINKILLDLYTLDNIESLASKFMRMCKMLIPHTESYFMVLDENQNIANDMKFYIGEDDTAIEKYETAYYDDDYLKFLYDITKDTVVFKDSDILPDDVRMETNYFKEYLKPKNIPYACGILIAKEGVIRGILTFFRGAEGDFTDKEVYILNIIKDHLQNKFYSLLDARESGRGVKEIKNEYQLTKREIDVLKLVNCGYTNEEIANILVVTLDTVKKHIYNLYKKTGVTSRVQLLRMISEKQQ
ncbi:MAG: helix-turn-helix transcriptional regulator [Bacillota bacterium]